MISNVSIRTGSRFFFTVVLLILTLITTPALATYYYVDSRDGDDLNDGSRLAPWKTISKVNNSQFLPGDKILFARGRTWTEMLQIPSSGVEGNPIVIDGYGRGFKPVIDCTFPFFGSWQQDAQNPNIWSFARNSAPGAIYYNGVLYPPMMSITLDPSVETLPDPGAILLQTSGGVYTNIWVKSVDMATKVVSGITASTSWDTQRNIRVRQVNPATGKEQTWFNQLPPPIDLTPKNISLQENGQWNWRDGRIYVYSDVHPSTANMSMTRTNYGIHTNGQSYLNIKNFEIIGANSVAVYLSGSNYLTVQKMRVDGVGLSGHHMGILLNDSSFNTITYNRVENSLGAGIGIYGSYRNVDMAQNNTILNNYIAEIGSSGIIVGADSWHKTYKVVNNVVAANIIYKANQIGYDTAGIYFYYTGDGNVIKRNRISYGGNANLRSAGIMVDIDVGPTLIERNTLRNNSHGGIIATETDHIIRYNTLDSNCEPQFKAAEIMFFRVNDYVANTEVYNNVFFAGDDQDFFIVENGSDIGHNIESNKYYGGSASPFRFEGQAMSFTEWQQLNGYDIFAKYRPN